MKLDIGAGPVAAHAPDFLTVDAFAAADVKAQMWDLPFPDGSVDEIWTSHALEHVPRERVMPTLREWHRVLCRGGVATISVPNLDYVAKYWLQHAGSPRALAIMFGNQKHEGEFHKTGWSLRSLKVDLRRAGFRIDSLASIEDHHQQTLRARVSRV